MLLPVIWLLMAVGCAGPGGVASQAPLPPEGPPGPCLRAGVRLGIVQRKVLEDGTLEYLFREVVDKACMDGS